MILQIINLAKIIKMSNLATTTKPAKPTKPKHVGIVDNPSNHGNLIEFECDSTSLFKKIFKLFKHMTYSIYIRFTRNIIEFKAEDDNDNTLSVKIKCNSDEIQRYYCRSEKTICIDRDYLTTMIFNETPKSVYKFKIILEKANENKNIRMETFTSNPSKRKIQKVNIIQNDQSVVNRLFGLKQQIKSKMEFVLPSKTLKVITGDIKDDTFVIGKTGRSTDEALYIKYLYQEQEIEHVFDCPEDISLIDNCHRNEIYSAKVSNISLKTFLSSIVTSDICIKLYPDTIYTSYIDGAFEITQKSKISPNE